MFKSGLGRAVLIVGVILSLGVAATASAADFGLFGFDVRAGVVVPSDWDTGYTVGASANVGEIVDGLFLYPGVAWSQAEDSEGAGFFEVDLEVTSLALGAEVRYYLDQAERGWYFGGGPYLHFLDREVAVFQRRAVSSIETEEVALTGVAGYLLGSEGSGLLVEARYSIVSGYDNGQLLLGFSF